MDMFKYEDKIYDQIAKPMIETLEEWDDCGYTRQDIELCKEALFDYLNNLEAISEPTDEAIMAEVKTLVLSLNEINEDADYSLIETDMRESLWEVIQEAAIECGLQNVVQDVTEEWREW